MNSQEMLEQLEGLAERMSIRVRYEKCRSRGGLCRVKQEQIIIVRKDLTVPEKVEIFSRALCRFPLEDYYLMPEVRSYLEKAASSVMDQEADLLDGSGSLEEESIEEP